MPKRQYVNLVKFDENGFPICEQHGAMLCVNKELTLYRCGICHIGIDTTFIFRYVERKLRT